MQYQDSYRKIYEPCHSNTGFFSLNMLSQVYRESIVHTIKMPFSVEAIGQSVNTNGITPYLDAILQNPVSSIALQKCLGSQEEEFKFVRNLIIADSFGRLVGISISIVGFKYIGILFSKLLSPIAKVISPKLEKWISYGMMGLGVIIPLVNVYHEQQKQDQDDDIMLIDEPTPELEVSIRLKESAIEQIKLIDQRLQFSDLTQLELRAFTEQRRQWTIVLENFK
jgi:hypothetical protein